MPLDLNTTPADGLYDGLAVYNGITIREIAGRSGNDTTTGSGTAERTWRLAGTTSPQTARAALTDGPVLIDTYDGMNIESLGYDQGPAYDVWDFTASYNATVPEIGGYTVSIDTSGGQVLQTSSYAQTKYARFGTTAPDFYRSIDVQDGKPQGVERIIPALKINVRAKIASAYITSPIAYAKIVSGLTGTVSSTAMFDGEFAAGELLFAGASGDVVAENPQLTFTFLASKNESSLAVGGIGSIVKGGHDYLWCLFDHMKDATTGMLVSRPRAVYVDRVYGLANFAALKIGEA